MKRIIFSLLLILFACSDDILEPEIGRNDNAVKLEINLSGSLQNPAFSPDGKTIVFTRFRN